MLQPHRDLRAGRKLALGLGQGGARLLPVQGGQLGATGEHVGGYERRRDLRDDTIAEGAQFSHSGGYPMSHATHIGFNSPPT